MPEPVVPQRLCADPADREGRVAFLPHDPWHAGAVIGPDGAADTGFRRDRSPTADGVDLVAFKRGERKDEPTWPIFRTGKVRKSSFHRQGSGARLGAAYRAETVITGFVRCEGDYDYIYPLDDKIGYSS